MNLFIVAVLVGFLGPALAVSAFAYAWRSVLQHVWWFIGIGASISYILMLACLTWTFSDIGMTGNRSGTPTPVLDQIAFRYVAFMLLWMAGSAVTLFIMRRFLLKA